MSISVGYDGSSILQGIQPTSIECAQLADMGETATGAFTVEDDAATLTTIGYQSLTISESACSQPRLFTGWTFERGYQRDTENAILTSVARTHDVSIIDMNACFGFRQITRTGTGGGNRPAETWAQRLTWILESEYLSDWISSNQSFVVTNTTAMEAADYRGSFPSSVMNDLSDRSGNAYDYFAFWDPAAKEVRLFFDNAAESIGDSTLRISNVLSDQDQLTTFGPDKLAKLQRESDQVYSDVCVNYAHGTLKLYRHRPSTAATFVRRSTQIDRPYTGGSATATLQAEAWLDKHATETDRVTCTIRVPASRAGLIQAGQRVQFKAPHMPGYDAFAWMRVVMCTPKPADETATLYDIALELVGQPVIGVDCATAIVASEPEYATGGYPDAPTVSITPTMTGPLLLIAGFAAGDEDTPKVSGMTAIAGYTTLLQDDSSRTTFTIGSRQEANPSGTYTATATFTYGFTPADSGWAGFQLGIATSATAPVQDVYADEAVKASLPSTPTPGNVLVMICKAEPGPTAHMAAPGAIHPEYTWTQLAHAHPPFLNEADVYMGRVNLEWCLYVRCVEAGDGVEYDFDQVGGYVQSASIYISEWVIAGGYSGGDDETTPLPPAPGSTTTHTTDPTVTDDSAAGYTVGSVWINETDGGVFVLVDSTAGAAVWVEVSASGAPTTVDYLVGTATGALSAEIVVGTTPGGELGGTWASPTVDASHSGSAHHSHLLDNLAATTDPAVTDDSGDGYAIGSRWINTTGDEEFVATDVTVGAAVWLSTTTGASGAPADVDYLVGTASGALSDEIVVGTTPGGELGGTWASPTVDATHSGSAHLSLGSSSSTAAAGDHTHAGSISGVPFQITAVFDAGADAITGNPEVDVVVPAAGTLTGWTMMADASGTFVVDVWKDTGGNFPPTNADSITNGHEPTLSGAYTTDVDLADWTSVALTAGDVIRFHVDSTATVKRVALTLTYTRS